MKPRLVLALMTFSLASACDVVSEVGKPCVLVRKARADDPVAPGTKAFPMKESEVNASGQDFVSFGSVGCEELICVRDAAFPKSENGDSPAQGYCSDECIVGSSTDTCKVTDGDALPTVKSRMTCRSLVLDPETLAALQLSDPASYKRIIGTNRSSTFCAGAITAK